MSIRRTITFPEKELQEELERLQVYIESLEDERYVLEERVDELEICLEIATDALDKIQNCDTEIKGDEILYYDAEAARDLAMIMASRALAEIEER